MGKGMKEIIEVRETPTNESTRVHRIGCSLGGDGYVVDIERFQRNGHTEMIDFVRVVLEGGATIEYPATALAIYEVTK